MLKMKVGDKIKCADKEDLVNTRRKLAKAGIKTEIDYDKNSWLVVTKIESEGE